MLYYIEDISGKVENYDIALFNAIKSEASKSSVRLLLPGINLLSIVPRKFKASENIIKRILKVAEGLLNYVYTLATVACTKPDVLHLQWLPFIEFNGCEVPILKSIKRLSPKTKLVLTIHNIYPHNMSLKAKKKYNIRFRKACALFDAFIVHTNISKEEVILEFGLIPDNVNVCCHGVFEPDSIKINTTRRKEGKLHILQFGGQSYYKGTDLLVDAVCGLDKRHKAKIETHIVGGISSHFLEELKAKDKDSIIKWKPYFLDDDELYQEINDSDIIVLPYRAISQSGVLLLSIYFGKLIICSDLPSFKETMRGQEGDKLDDSLFFKREDADSLKKILTRYIDKNINEKDVQDRVQHLKKLYSWTNAAKSTLDVYNKLTNICK